ncbi:hypothetical protein B0H14DRAFT_3714926 [Mycena olivaceomarginata]|nr:hypothetical protein B0H14DRAFT_3714926 [Mycena olivaceomarginata]
MGLDLDSAFQRGLQIEKEYHKARQLAGAEVPQVEGARARSEDPQPPEECDGEPRTVTRRSAWIWAATGVVSGEGTRYGMATTRWSVRRKGPQRKIGERERANLGELRYERDNPEHGLDVDVARARMSELHQRRVRAPEKLIETGGSVPLVFCERYVLEQMEPAGGDPRAAGKRTRAQSTVLGVQIVDDEVAISKLLRDNCAGHGAFL